MSLEEKHNLIDKEIKCLDHGFVRLVDFMGDDSSIVQAARVSYGKGTKSVREDTTLIRYLMRHQHTSPFEMVELKFHIRLPIFVARQWIRHRTANVNEYSGRYSEMTDDFYIPEQNQIRTQDEVNKQGRSDKQIEDATARDVLQSMQQHQKDSYDEYLNYLDKGVAREIARINLPLSSYTEWYWKIDLHNLFRFLKLRLDWHAQYEIRVYAEAIANIIKELYPISFQAFSDYILNSVTFSYAELSKIKAIFGNLNIEDLEDNDPNFSKFEKIELQKKIEFINKIE